MTAVAPTMQAFFTERLAQRRASAHTVAAYRDGLRLLLGYLHDSTGVAPSALDFDDLDAGRIGAFLDHLEAERHVSVATRNARLAAVHSLAGACASLAAKRVSHHVLRHTAAMRLLESGTDTAVIALWLGHESPRTTQIYLHAHLALKERALARTTPPNTSPGRYRPSDQLLAFLDSL